MNGKRWFPGAISLVVILSAALIVLAACTSKAPAVSGKCETASEPTSANFRSWVSQPDGLLHFRDGMLLLTCTINDERLKGDWGSTGNFDGNATDYSGMYYGLWWVNGTDGKALWEGNGHGYGNASGQFSAKMTLYGRGTYEGLQAEFNVSKAKDDKQYILTGEILEAKK